MSNCRYLSVSDLIFKKAISHGSFIFHFQHHEWERAFLGSSPYNKMHGIMDIIDISPLAYPSHTPQFHTGILSTATECWLTSTLTVDVVLINMPGILSRARSSTV